MQLSTESIAANDRFLDGGWETEQYQASGWLDMNFFSQNIFQSYT